MPIWRRAFVFSDTNSAVKSIAPCWQELTLFLTPLSNYTILSDGRKLSWIIGGNLSVGELTFSPTSYQDLSEDIRQNVVAPEGTHIFVDITPGTLRSPYFTWRKYKNDDFPVGTKYDITPVGEGNITFGQLYDKVEAYWKGSEELCWYDNCVFKGMHVAQWWEGMQMHSALEVIFIDCKPRTQSGAYPVNLHPVR